MAANVRSHTRTRNGRTEKVQRHSRTTKGRHKRPAGSGGIFRPRRAVNNLKRAYKAARRHRNGTATALGLLAFGELGCWLTLRGVMFTAGALAVLAGSVAVLAASATSSPSSSKSRSSKSRGARKPRRS